MADQSTSLSSRNLVVIGSSAGGIEALLVIVSSLPENFAAPVVLAQHLDPNRASNLSTIFQRRTSLPVIEITAHTYLEVGKIYVAPANCHVTINDGYIETQEDTVGRPKPSVDLLLSSAAKVYGERLVAVILTGTGSDGSAGAIEVKHSGGVVIIQNPQTARFPGMPLALPPTIVDLQVDLERIGPILYKLLTGISLPPDEQQGQVLGELLEFLKDQLHINISIYKASALLRCMGYRMLVSNCSAMGDYLNYVKSVPTEAVELVKSLLATSPQFFRDPDAFASLRSTVLPELVARGYDRHRVLRCWSAGCATGEDAYSLAMLLTDMLGAELPQWTIKIFATDLNAAAITFARRGLYPENVLQGLPPGYKERFFDRADHGHHVKKMLRQMVVFGAYDLASSTPFPAIDLIMCRNVLGYFTPETQERILAQFAFSLFPGGYLLLDKTEAIRPSSRLYTGVKKNMNVYRCVSKALLETHLSGTLELTKLSFQGRLSSHALLALGKQHEEVQVSRSGFDLGQLRHFNELLFRSLPIGIVVIDRSYRIVTANTISRRLLRLSSDGGEQDFLHSASGIPYAEVRVAIDRAFEEGKVIALREVGLDASVGGSGHYVELTINPIGSGMAVAPELAVISIIDMTEQVRMLRRMEALRSEQTQLVKELGASNERLDEVNKALVEANERLQATNEDMILIQEDLQARLEELETTNEESQANLEEVEANNEEFQSAYEALQKTIEELQEQNAILTVTQAHLAEIIAHIPCIILVLSGPELLVESFHVPNGEWLREETIIGRPLEHISRLIWEDGLQVERLARRVYNQDVSQILPTMHALQTLGVTGKLLFMLVPSHHPDGSVSGVIIYGINGTELAEKKSEVQSIDTAS